MAIGRGEFRRGDREYVKESIVNTNYLFRGYLST